MEEGTQEEFEELARSAEEIGALLGLRYDPEETPNEGLYEAVCVFVETCGFVDADEDAIALSFADLNGLPLGTFLIRKGELKEALDE